MLSWQDRDRADGVEITFRASKADQTRRGETITRTRLSTLHEAGRGRGGWGYIGCRLPHRRLVLDRHHQQHHGPRRRRSSTFASPSKLSPRFLQQHRVDSRAYRHLRFCAAHRKLPRQHGHRTHPPDTPLQHYSTSAPSAVAATSALFLYDPAPTSGTRLNMDLGGSEKSRSFCHLETETAPSC